MTKKEKARDKYLQKKYGITLQEYNTKLQDQNDSCDLCKKHKSCFKRALAVDHDHKTGKVRGLVCFYCNHKLIFKHTLDTAKRLLDYMERHD